MAQGLLWEAVGWVGGMEDALLEATLTLFFNKTSNPVQALLRECWEVQADNFPSEVSFGGSNCEF